MEYRDKVRYVRTKVRDMTLKELSKRTELSVSYLSDAELGRTAMSIVALEKVAEALGTTSSYLLDAKNMTLQQLADLNQAELPIDVVEYLAKKSSLPYISLIKEIDENNTFSLDLPRTLIEIHERGANTVGKEDKLSGGWVIQCR